MYQADTALGRGQGEADAAFGGDSPVRSAARHVDHRVRSHRGEHLLQVEGIAKVEMVPCRPVVVAGTGMVRGGRVTARGYRLAY